MNDGFNFETYPREKTSRVRVVLKIGDKEVLVGFFGSLEARLQAAKEKQEEDRRREINERRIKREESRREAQIRRENGTFGRKAMYFRRPKHGHVGIHFTGRKKPWQAKISIGNGIRLAKAFHTKEEAIEWRIEMEKKYGYEQKYQEMASNGGTKGGN